MLSLESDMNNQLYIPKKLNVGFQLRSDCYSKKLGYVIYWDDKGKLRKENSWQSWRQKPEDAPRTYNHETKKYDLGESYGERVAPIVLDNVPVEGFVLNKDVGGVRSGWGWNDRIEKVRVYDPRDFEFEISVPNLLYILQECSSIKGKGLEGEFVYSWSGTELVLLPTTAKEYIESQGFTELQGKKFSMKDLKVGHKYMNKNHETAVYAGRNFFFNKPYYANNVSNIKDHIFYEFDPGYGKSNFTKSFKPIEDQGEYADFSDIISEFKKTNHGKEVIGLLEGKELQERYQSGIVKTTTGFVLSSVNCEGYYSQKTQVFYYEGSFEIKNGELRCKAYDNFNDKALTRPREMIVEFSDGTKLNLNQKTNQ